MEGQPEDRPLAVYHRHKRYFFMLKMSRLPYLEVDPSLMETLDTVIGMYRYHPQPAQTHLSFG